MGWDVMVRIVNPALPIRFLCEENVEENEDVGKSGADFDCLNSTTNHPLLFSTRNTTCTHPCSALLSCAVMSCDEL